MKILNVFISSPGDCSEERGRVDDVISRINCSEVAKGERIKLYPVRWEHLPSRADASRSPQEDFDAVLRHFGLKHVEVFLVILKHEVGTPTNGEISGTMHEIKRALITHRKQRRPAWFLVYFDRVKISDSVKDHYFTFLDRHAKSVKRVPYDSIGEFDRNVCEQLTAIAAEWRHTKNWLVRARPVVRTAALASFSVACIAAIVSVYGHSQRSYAATADVDETIASALSLIANEEPWTDDALARNQRTVALLREAQKRRDAHKESLALATELGERAASLVAIGELNRKVLRQLSAIEDFPERDVRVEELDRAYQSAFALLDVRPYEQEEAQASQLVRASSLYARLVRSLDRWSLFDLGDDRRQKLVRLALACDTVGAIAELRRLRLRGAWDEVASIAEAIDWESVSSETVAQYGLALASAGQLERAIHIFEQGRLRFPREFDFPYYMAIWLLQRDRVPGHEVLLYLNEARILRPNVADLYVWISSLEWDKGNQAGSIATLEAAIRIVPRFQLLAMLAPKYAAIDDQDNACRTLQQAFDAAPPLPRSLAERDRVAQERYGDWRPAEPSYARTVLLADLKSTGDLHVVNAFMVDGRLDPAIAAEELRTALIYYDYCAVSDETQTALLARKARAQAWYQLGRIQLDSGDWTDAVCWFGLVIDEFEAGVRWHGELEETLYDVALAHAALGHSETAHTLLKDICERMPGEVRYRLALADVAQFASTKATTAAARADLVLEAATAVACALELTGDSEVRWPNGIRVAVGANDESATLGTLAEEGTGYQLAKMAWTCIAELEFGRDRMTAVREAYRRAFDLDRSDTMLAGNLAKAALTTLDLATAGEAADVAFGSEPQDPNLRYWLTVALLASGRRRDGIERFRQLSALPDVNGIEPFTAVFLRLHEMERSLEEQGRAEDAGQINDAMREVFEANADRKRGRRD